MGVAQARTPVEVEASRRQFDFWLGEWDATWGDGDQGTNSVYQSFRMRWFELGDEAFDWAWERSLDGGATWEALWEIRYSRVV